jgi:hypothetical protein
MRARRSVRTAWVRGCVVLGFLIAAVGFFFLCGHLVESGHRGLGNALADVDWALLSVVVLLGPAWVDQALHPPTPTDDGPPRGRIVPFPTPEAEGSRHVGRNRFDEAARVAVRRPLGLV